MDDLPTGLHTLTRTFSVKTRHCRSESVHYQAASAWAWKQHLQSQVSARSLIKAGTCTAHHCLKDLPKLKHQRPLFGLPNVTEHATVILLCQLTVEGRQVIPASAIMLQLDSQKKQPESTWWLIPLRKWVITPVINGLTLLIPFITGVITHLLSGMSHQVELLRHEHRRIIVTVGASRFQGCHSGTELTRMWASQNSSRCTVPSTIIHSMITFPVNIS